MARTRTRLVLALPTMPRIHMPRNPIRKYFRRRRWDWEELKGGPWWRVQRATEEREGAALEEGNLRKQEGAEEASGGTAISASQEL
ncbi:hypothetical protein NDU88_007378 [Pleurodeles waltl]|uniref:Uncharacterized protein n=1 Tax=Pleurodeles waltl TaxID=8319 RepID=A0AAV7QNW0_PLEWA|nr:hypothetical protein NDU88_007378 [Pleurodeles waltl]